MFAIKLTKIAAESLRGVDSKTRSQIISKIDQLRENPEKLGKPLVGALKEFRSVRAAGQRYRIIYKLLNEEVVVIVVAVGIRKSGDKKDIYELMKKYVKIGLLDQK